MIVEDQQVLLDLYSEKFIREGYEVLTCMNGLEAVTKLDSFHPDAILLDIMMPQMDGFETLRVMRKLVPSVQTKILIFSNLSWTEHIERCLSLWADDYIIKAESTPGKIFTRVHNLITTQSLQETIIENTNSERSSEGIICPYCGTQFTPTIHIESTPS